MRAAAGVQIQAIDLDQPHRPFALWQFAQRSAGEERLGLLPGNRTHSDRAVFRDDLVSRIFDAVQLLAA